MRLFVLLMGAAVLMAAPALPVFDAERYVAHVKYLAAPEMKGRFTGSPEQEKAARYIAREFERIGLASVTGKKGYYQTFKLITSSRAGQDNKMTVHEGGKASELKYGDQFTTFSFSASAKVSAPVVFAGYGITAPDLKYDDYAGLDVKDKIVLVLRQEPQELDEKSVFAGRDYTMHAALENKAINAKNHGAKALFFINNTVTHPQDGTSLDGFSKPGPADVNIAFGQIQTVTAERWLGRSIQSIVESIDRDLKPVTFPLPVTLDVQTDVERVQKQTHNVIGYLPGQTDEYVVIGGHYDHIGMGEQFSLAPSQVPSIHHGADDNASGTAGVIELARWFAGQPKGKRGVLFMAYTGEELGLLGSNYYVNHPLLPLEKCVAMINLDMIGRLKDGRLVLGGGGTGSTFGPMLEALVKRHTELALDYSEPAGFGGSDHTSFSSKQIPVLFFFSGLHADYHKPSDTWEKVDGVGGTRVLSLVADAARELVSAGGRPEFVKVAPPAAPVSGGSRGGGGGYGPYFGSIPDMGASDVKGVRFADLREGSPAMKAGLKPGDVMVEFDGKKIEGLYDYTYALRQRKPGDTVKVKVLRKGEPVEAEVTLTERR